MAEDLAQTQASCDNIENVGMVAWFGIESLDGIDGVNTHSLDIKGTYRINREQYAAAKSILSDYDIIHTHRPHSGFYGKLVAKRLGKPVVQTEHNNHVGYTIKGQVANGVTNLLADAVVCVSESVHESFAWWEDIVVRDGKVHISHNGVDIERIKQAGELNWSLHDMVDIDSEAVLVGSAGMLTEQKAHDVLIEAVDRANAKSQQPIELVISGDGELREPLKRQITDAEYSERLHLLGFLEEREQVYKMMNEIDIYAMPSRWEGFCVAALEAMALGTPCVFSDIPEFKRPFQEVARFHTTDDAVSMSRAIASLADTPDERQMLGEKSRELVASTYTMEHTAAEYLKKYIEISFS